MAVLHYGKTATIDSGNSIVKKIPRYGPLPSEEREKEFRSRNTEGRRQESEYRIVVVAYFVA